MYYDEISNISYRSSIQPFLTFDYRDRHLGIPYSEKDEQEILEIFEKIKQKNDLSVTQRFKSMEREAEAEWPENEEATETADTKVKIPEHRKKTKRLL